MNIAEAGFKQCADCHSEWPVEDLDHDGRCEFCRVSPTERTP